MPLTARNIITASGLAAALLLGACSAGHGNYTSEFRKQSAERLERIKAGTNWDMAHQQFLAGDLKKAIKTVDESLILAEQVPKSHVLRARILIEQGRLESAQASLERAIEIDPTHVDAWYYRGIVFERFSKFDQAHENFVKASELDPTNPQFIVAAAEMLIHENDLDAAEAILTQGTELFEHNAGLRQTLGHIAMMRGDISLAISIFNEACLLAPAEASLIEDLARAQLAGGLWSEAEYSLSRLRALPTQEDRRDLMHIHSRALLELNRPVEARELLVKLTKQERGGGDVEAWIGLAKASLILNDRYRMYDAARRAVAIAPNRHEGYTYMAVFLRSEGQLASAAATLERALKQSPNQADPAILLALVYQDLGQLDQALRAAELAVSIDPSNQQARLMAAGMAMGMSSNAVADVPTNDDN